jgi:hypothetical protein
VDVITTAELASWLRDPALEDNPSLEQIVDLVNELVNEEWASPADPVPARIRLLALSVGARAWVNDPSKTNLESLSRQLDDAARTERYRASAVNAGVYLTGDELAILHGKRRSRSVRLVAYGEYQ